MWLFGPPPAYDIWLCTGASVLNFMHSDAITLSAPRALRQGQHANASNTIASGCMWNKPNQTVSLHGIQSIQPVHFTNISTEIYNLTSFHISSHGRIEVGFSCGRPNIVKWFCVSSTSLGTVCGDGFRFGPPWGFSFCFDISGITKLNWECTGKKRGPRLLWG